MATILILAAASAQAAPDRATRVLVDKSDRWGVSPGGDIMVHGESNNEQQREAIRRHPSRDYTYGCIALSNRDMQRFWGQISVPLPIEIVP